MRIQIRRIKRAENHEHNRIDLTFVNATIANIPREGENMTVAFDRLGYGTWYTTKVVERIAHPDYLEIKTVNSTYHIKFGWEEN